MILEPTTWTGWDYGGLAVLMVLSFFVANTIAWWLETGRQKRICEKTRILSEKSHLRTPVTIITGFLGSGKTTLINHILTSEAHGKRIVVIENEVGSVSIDDKLLRADEQEKAAVGIFVMKNGCMCCTAGGGGGGPELERVLNHLIELKDDDEYDYVVIETSGLADPAGRFFLDGVITLVDAKNVWIHLDGSSWSSRTPEIARQLAHATTVLINKMDTVTLQSGHGSVPALEQEIAKICPDACMHYTTNSQVCISELLDQRAFDSERISKAGRTEEELEKMLCASECAEQQEVIYVEKFQQWAMALVADPSLVVYRIKGVLNVHKSDKVYVFQGVCGELKGQYFRKWDKDESRISQVVVIGKGLDRAALKMGFDACCDIKSQ